MLRLGPTYLVKKGDTLLRLADRFGMTLAQLRYVYVAMSSDERSEALELRGMYLCRLNLVQCISLDGCRPCNDVSMPCMSPL